MHIYLSSALSRRESHHVCLVPTIQTPQKMGRNCTTATTRGSAHLTLLFISYPVLPSKQEDSHCEPTTSIFAILSRRQMSPARRHYFIFTILPIMARSFVFQLVPKKACRPAFCRYGGYLVASSVAMIAYWVSGLVAVLAIRGFQQRTGGKALRGRVSKSEHGGNCAVVAWLDRQYRWWLNGS